ncbi:MAG: hypothetical protein AAF639_36610 [Chloroflexota bacterium]
MASLTQAETRQQNSAYHYNTSDEAGYVSDTITNGEAESYQANTHRVHVPSSNLFIGTIHAQIWVGTSPWRLTAIWSVLAACLVFFGHSQNANIDLQTLGTLDWSTIVLFILLVDPLWNAIWRFSDGSRGLLREEKQEQSPNQDSTHAASLQFWLPYLRSNSPAARLFQGSTSMSGDAKDMLPLLIRVVLPTLLVTFGVAVILGPSAVVCTVILVICTLIGWICKQTLTLSPSFLYSFVAIGLPWSLTLLQLQIFFEDPARLLAVPSFAQAFSSTAFLQLESSATQLQLLLITLWVLHRWGELMIKPNAIQNLGAMWVQNPVRFFSQNLGIGLLVFTEIMILGLFVYLQALLSVALLIIFFVPVWLSIYNRQSLTRVYIWPLFAMLLSSLILGQSLF